MQPVVLAALMVAMLVSDGQTGLHRSAPSWQTPLALAGYLLVALALRQAATRAGLRRLRRQDAGLPGSLRRHQLLSLAADLWLAGAQAIPLALGYASWALDTLGLAGWPLVGKALLLVPYLGAQLLCWRLQYPFWQAARHRAVPQGSPTWSPRDFLAHNLRHNLLFVLVPVALIVLAGDLLALAAARDWIAPAVMLGASLASAVLVFLLAPALIVRIWRTTSLPAGQARAGLEDLCRRLGLRYRDIRLWHTGGVIANAGVMGLVGPLRYILVTDALLAGLPPPQVQAVFAHEAAHILFRHIPYSLLFALSAIVTSLAAGELLGWALGLDELTTSAAAMGLLAAAFFAGFGAISRRLERQSDVFAAWALGPDPQADPAELTVSFAGANTFATALEQVGRLNGTSPRQFNWRHGSIDQRVDYVLFLADTGGSRRQIDRVVRRIKAILWVCGAASAALVTWGFLV